MAVHLCCSFNSIGGEQTADKIWSILGKGLVKQEHSRSLFYPLESSDGTTRARALRHTQNAYERDSAVGTRALAPSFDRCQRTKNILPPLFRSHNRSTEHHNPTIWKKIRSFPSLSVISLREKLIQERTAQSFSAVSLSFINRRVGVRHSCNICPLLLYGSYITGNKAMS